MKDMHILFTRGLQKHTDSDLSASKLSVLETSSIRTKGKHWFSGEIFCWYVVWRCCFAAKQQLIFQTATFLTTQKLHHVKRRIKQAVMMQNLYDSHHV